MVEQSEALRVNLASRDLPGSARHDELPDEQLNDFGVLIARLDANGDDAAIRAGS